MDTLNKSNEFGKHSAACQITNLHHKHLIKMDVMPHQSFYMKPNVLTLMFLSMSPLQREMSGTVKGFHAGSKVFLMT